VHQEVNKTTADARLNDSLDLVVGAVRKVRDGPARINEDLVVKRVDELGEDGESGGDEGPVGLGRLATAEVGKSPGGVAEHRELVVLVEELEKGAESLLAEDKVTALGRVTSNVTESPDSLLADIDNTRSEESNEVGDGAGGDDDLGVLRGARSNVSKSPGGLELEHGVGARKELDELGDDATLDDTVDGRALLLGQELAELGGRVQLLLVAAREDLLRQALQCVAEVVLAEVLNVVVRVVIVCGGNKVAALGNRLLAL
jgi:hypothetical protein